MSRYRRWLRLALFAWAFVALALQHARAEDSTPESSGDSDATIQARAHFKKGVDYYTEGDLSGALVELKRAYEIEPSYRLLYNLAQVSYELRDYAQAEHYFRTYLSEGGTEIEPERRDEVHAELERLKERVADVLVRSNLAGAQLFVDQRAAGKLPLAGPIRVSAGRRTLRVELPGHAPVQRVIDVVGGEPQQVELAFTPLHATSAQARVASTSRVSPALWTGIATGVLGLGAAGMAVWTQSEQARYDGALERETSRSELDELTSSTEQKALVTDVLLGATVITGAITVVLLLTDGPSEQDERSAYVQLGPGSVRATF